MIFPTKKPQQVRPSIRSAAISYFYGGVSLPAGTYRVKYGGAAFQWGGNPAEWGVGDAFLPSQGFYIRHSGSVDLYGPQLNSTYYPTASAAQLANAAAPPVTFTHTGGPIGMFLQDSNYTDNVASDWGTPLFILEYVGPAVAWSPLQLPGLIGWYRSDGQLWQNAARTIPAIAEGDRIGAWDDLSGAGNHITQTLVGRRPTLVLGGINGQRLLSFDNTFNNWLSRGGVSGMSPSTPLFMWGVLRPYNVGRMFGVGSIDGEAAYTRMFASNQIGAVSVNLFTDQTTTQIPGGTLFGNWLRVAGSFPNQFTRSIQTNLNTPTFGGGTANSPAHTGLAVGADWNAGAGFAWITQEMPEVLFTNQIPSAGQLTQLDDYAKARYAL